ncbi:unnamed protein product [Citrullus colocynthis]|uniref:Uncharacterized protein n=1 Tax=Citrullus colocynthis TaxID=252529 RepID=A0ABP0Y606_9ROSI
MDRDYGVLNRVFHNITDTYIVHHLFSTMPHYHAKEATEAVKKVLGEYYRMDRTNVLKAIWREAKECVYVEADEDADSDKGVVWSLYILWEDSSVIMAMEDEKTFKEGPLVLEVSRLLHHNVM